MRFFYRERIFLWLLLSRDLEPKPLPQLKYV